MPNWSEVLKEIQQYPGGLDNVRRKYLRKLSKITGRNVVAYYSGWLQKPSASNAAIVDDDKNGFMNAIHKLDRSKGVDLILHTPGGDFAATESIVHYLRKMFEMNIRCFIPQLAMSGGTMIACACKEILMGCESNIGPIDPQFSGIPAHGVIAEFRQACEEVAKDPKTIPIWQAIISKYHPTFLGECQNAIDLANDIVGKWLETGMFEGDRDAFRKARNIVGKLNNHVDTKMHARHIHADEARQFGLKVTMIEENNTLQDTVLTIHHAYMHTFGNSPASKIIENHLGSAMVYMAPGIRQP